MIVFDVHIDIVALCELFVFRLAIAIRVMGTTTSSLVVVMVVGGGDGRGGGGGGGGGVGGA